MAAVVQQITGNVTPDYGIVTGTISTSEYNSLIAFASWNTAGVAGTSVSIPAVNVTDSAGNCWRQIGISNALVPGGVRCAVWAALNAQAVSWVSVSLAGWGAATSYSVAEISGLPQALSLDFSVSNAGTAGGGTTISVAGIASGADIGFALLATDQRQASVAGPAGWTALSSSVTAAGAAGTASAYPYWNTGIAAGTATASWSFTQVNSNSAIIYCGISASASPPQQYNRNFPLVMTETAFGATPGDIRASLDYTFDDRHTSWQDISSRVIGADIGGRISTSRGREYELQQEESGELVTHLDNHDGAFIPGNTASPYYSNALNSNMSFENGTGGWIASNGALAPSTAQAFSGTQSAQLTPTGGNTQAFISSTQVTVNPNYPLSSSAWFYANGPYFYDSLVPVSSPSGWWKLADAAGSRVAADSSGNLHNGVASAVTFGNANKAVTADTSASFGGTATSSGVTTNWFPALTPVTVEAWVNKNGQAQSGNPRILCAGHTDADFTGFELMLNGGTAPRIVFGNGTTSDTVTGASNVPASGWSYLAATWNGTTVTLYVDGVSAGTGSLSGSMGAATGPVSIGYDATYNGDYFNGLIAQCAVYPSALAGTAIAAHYAAGPLSAGANIDWYGPGGYISTTSSGGIQVPAGTWTQAATLGGSAPAGANAARISTVLGGTPTASDAINIDEAALVYGTAAVATNLITLEVPARTTAWWNGRQYPLWSGYTERWPLHWQELPQWGFAAMVATDAIAVVSIGEMASALDGEVLIDNPYAYLPCKEQYTNAFTGATSAQPFLFGTSPYFAPADANGLIAVNKAANNQVTGTYGDGLGGQVSTGLDISFLGDSGTGMGTDSFGSAATGQQGPRMTYADPGMAAATTAPLNTGAFSVEFWFLYGGTAGSCDFISLYGPPSAYLASEETALNTLVSNGDWVQLSAIGTLAYVITSNGSQLLTGYTSNGGSAPQHVVISWSGGNILLYVNGNPAQIPGLLPGALGSYGVNAIVLGAGRYAYDCDNAGPIPYGIQNYTAGHLAVYPYALSYQRIVSHYTTGLSGAQGVTAAQRYAQILTWAGFGLRRGGYLWSSATGAAEVTTIGPAYSLEGASAASNLYAIEQSEGGLLNVQGNGSLIYTERWATYNAPVSDYLGDNATSDSVPMNANPGFGGSVNPWFAQNGSLSFVSSPLYGPGAVGSALLSPSAAAGTAGYSSIYASSRPVSVGGTYTAGAWVYSSGGYSTITIGFDWELNNSYVSSSISNFSVAAASWSYFETSFAAPLAGVNQGVLRIGEGNNPGTGNTLNIAWGAMIARSPEIPALGDAEFDYDNTYIYNEAIVTQEDGPNQLFTVDDRNIPSQNALFKRTALSISANVGNPYDVSDNATWQLSEFGTPTLRVATITIDLASNPSIAKRVLSLEINDVITYTRRPLGSQPITTSGPVQRISHEIGPGYFRVKLQIAPGVSTQNVLAADITGYDTPATTELGW